MAMMGEDVLTGLQENLHQIGHIQFADYPNRHEPDTGNIPYKANFDWLRQSDYQGYIGAEYRPKTQSDQSLHGKKSTFPMT